MNDNDARYVRNLAIIVVAAICLTGYALDRKISEVLHAVQACGAITK